MKMKTIWFVVILIVVTTIIINLNFDSSKEEFNPLEINVGDEFSGIGYKNKMYVLNYAIGEVTGDNENDMIILVAEKNDINNSFCKNADLVIFDTTNKNFIKADLKNFEGESPKIIITNLTEDNINDVIVSLENKNKEKNIRILTKSENALKEIWGTKENSGINFNGEVIDGVKAYVKCNKLKKEMYIDLTNRKEELIKNKMIDESGKVISESKKVNTSSFRTIDVVKLNNQNGIRTTQIINSFNGKEIIDEITAIWKYENGKWQIKEAKGTKIGNLIY